jgi:hypothetical protein
VGVLSAGEPRPRTRSQRPSRRSASRSGQGISAALEGTNITERLLRAKLALEMTFDAMPELVAILDQDGRIRRLNKSLACRDRPPAAGADRESRSSTCCPSARVAGRGRGRHEQARRAGELQEAHTGAVYEASLLQIHGPTPFSASGS